MRIVREERRTRMSQESSSDDDVISSNEDDVISSNQDDVISSNQDDVISSNQDDVISDKNEDEDIISNNHEDIISNNHEDIISNNHEEVIPNNHEDFLDWPAVKFISREEAEKTLNLHTTTEEDDFIEEELICTKAAIRIISLLERLNGPIPQITRDSLNQDYYALVNNRGLLDYMEPISLNQSNYSLLLPGRGIPSRKDKADEFSTGLTGLSSDCEQTADISPSDCVAPENYKVPFRRVVRVINIEPKNIILEPKNIILESKDL
ncbi:Replicase polyprotein 1a [Thelohanellus kitauei]|uniref:Replicase polyprotein 1a n=1 Tax=Thelohanellus kitauei TaxID=669202 RepID=A0A0C2MA08_THEKT|nr:Replicase polyprotein 1a [Thelohanellus kitauei]